MMIGPAILLFALVSQAPPPPPPPDLSPHPELASARRDEAQHVALQAMSFTIQKPLRPGETTPLGASITLSKNEREELLRLLGEPATYSETPGVYGCMGREYVLTLHLSDRKIVSWFCSRCEQFLSVEPNGEPRFDAALSEKGSKALRTFFAGVVNPGRAR